MMKYSKIQKLTNFLLLSNLLMNLSGCFTSRKTISSSEIPFSSKYYYVIHSQKSKYFLENAIISDGILSGKIDNEESAHFGSKVHLYLSTDSVIEVNNMERALNISLDRIGKVEIEKMATQA
jgi:hypothetical protein